MKSFMLISHWIIPCSRTGLLSSWLWLLSPHQRTRSWPLDPSFRSWGSRAFCPPFAEETTDRKFKLKVKQCSIRSESRDDGLVEVYLNRRILFQSSESVLSSDAKVIHPRLLAGWRNVGRSLLPIKLFGQQFCELIRMLYGRVNRDIASQFTSHQVYTKRVSLFKNNLNII